ncbi:hypothetical protein MHUMG1_07048 [Metarhizium humberi]|uniref:Ribosome maturation protein SDO1/SBDS N-terminal domain-containing protein n=1 Tax=Metarhizium humberi TaxID=2596975 RepID=A0A9P8M7M5_9HYPO|nr:hypothetical protein MHUMG1_07048 [Metarhizium humberi]
MALEFSHLSIHLFHAVAPSLHSAKVARAPQSLTPRNSPATCVGPQNVNDPDVTSKYTPQTPMTSTGSSPEALVFPPAGSSRISPFSTTAHATPTPHLPKLTKFLQNPPPQRNKMTRGESTQTKIHYKGSDDDFLVFVEDVDQYKQWLKGDTQGAQGTYDAAPKNVLYSEFGTDDDDEVIKKILKGGSMQTMEMPGRQGVTNESMSSMKTH